MKDLYIFVTTDRPDQYLNPIAHCILKGTKRIVLVQIEDYRIDQINLNLLRANIYDLAKNLSLGKYKYYIGKNKDTVIDLDPLYNYSEVTKLKSQYIPILTDNIEWETKKIKYLDLRKYVSSLSKTSRENIAFDVTSVSKIYIGDIFACCLLENVDKVYSFELLVRPDYDNPWKILIHELEEGKGYRYVNLVETHIFKTSSKDILIRTTPLLISIIGTVLFVALTLAANLMLGTNSVVTQSISAVGTALGIISFLLIYFPIRSK